MFASKLAKPLARESTSLRRSMPLGRRLGRDPASLTARATTPDVAWDFRNVQLFSTDREERSQPSSLVAATSLPGPIQAKLIVGQNDDPLEHEADRVADQVMRLPPRRRRCPPDQRWRAGALAAPLRQLRGNARIVGKSAKPERRSSWYHPS
jgi:hypothetical protein